MPALNRMRPQAKGDALAILGEGRKGAQKPVLCFQ